MMEHLENVKLDYLPVLEEEAKKEAEKKKKQQEKANEDKFGPILVTGKL